MEYEFKFVNHWMEDKEVEEGIIYILKDPFITNVFFRCPCPLHDYVMLPIFPKSEGIGWSIEIYDWKATITPSIRQGGCKSHYFIRNNKVKFL